MSVWPIGTTSSSTAAQAAAGIAAGTAAAGGAASSGDGTNQVDENTFLKLMVAQLQNQDPMNPTDSSQFLSQTAQFTSLEKLTAVADELPQLTSAQMAFGAAGFMGRTVSYTDDSGAQQTGAVTGVNFTSTGPVLDVGGTDVPVTSVVGLTS